MTNPRSYTCSECGQQGHNAKKCGIILVRVPVFMPSGMLEDVDAFALRLPVKKRSAALTRLIIEGLVRMEHAQV